MKNLLFIPNEQLPFFYKTVRLLKYTIDDVNNILYGKEVDEDDNVVGVYIEYITAIEEIINKYMEILKIAHDFK
ncbi:hypothetical protein FC777_02280 [Clostridium botulinum]|nr:hypothetical protein [Clostridium botulinum]